MRLHSEPYDPAIAQEALDWLAGVKQSTVVPEPEKDASYCQFYCKYYDATGEMGCVGIKKERIKTEGLPPIEDEAISANALTYLQLDERIKEMEKERDAIKESLLGVTGVTDYGVEIKWTSVAGRATVDAEEVEKLLGFVPKKQGQETQRISVKLNGGK